jgi:hypothetical protein
VLTRLRVKVTLRLHSFRPSFINGRLWLNINTLTWLDAIILCFVVLMMLEYGLVYIGNVRGGSGVDQVAPVPNKILFVSPFLIVHIKNM